MELYILRHGIAESEMAFGSETERPLTDEGTARMKRIADAFEALDVVVDTILTSPLVRAHQTAAIAGRALKCPVVTVDALSAGASPSTFVEAIGAHAFGRERVMVVGHEPDLSRLVTMLVSGVDRSSVRIKRGGLVKLMVMDLRAGPCALLEWSLWPRHLVRLG